MAIDAANHRFIRRVGQSLLPSDWFKPCARLLLPFFEAYQR
jgi:hypothetical protein